VTTDQKAEEHKAIQLEAKGRRELLCRLEHPAKLLKAAGDKERIRREERTAQARQYQTVNEAQDAYGWDVITEDEYRAIVKAIEAGEEYVTNTVTPVELAAKILTDFTSRLSSELRGLEFELLPVDEQLKRMEAAEKRREEMEARRATRRSGGGTDGLDNQSNPAPEL
jgi:hypothetical protein